MDALFEDDSAKILGRIADAELAVAARIVELAEDTNQLREQQAMENATYFLQLLRKIENKKQLPYESAYSAAFSILDPKAMHAGPKPRASA